MNRVSVTRALNSHFLTQIRNGEYDEIGIKGMDDENDGNDMLSSIEFSIGGTTRPGAVRVSGIFSDIHVDDDNDDDDDDDDDDNNVHHSETFVVYKSRGLQYAAVHPVSARRRSRVSGTVSRTGMTINP